MRAKDPPEWLVGAVRLCRGGQVPWRDMLRAGIAICVPLSVAIAAGQRSLGLLIAMGGLMGTVVDRGGAYAERVRRVAAAAVFGGAVGLVTGSLIHGRGWVAVVALVGVAGVSALLSAVGDVGSVTGLQLLIYSAFGLGPVGALRPWWHTALGFMLGAAWALVLTVPGRLRSPRAAERRSVAAVYRGLAAALDAAGTHRFAAARRALTAALNTAYDTLTPGSAAGRGDVRMARLTAVLNEANPIAEAIVTLDQERNRPPPAVIDAVAAVAAALDDGASPVTPAPWGSSPGARALRGALAGLALLLEGAARPVAPPPRPPLRERAGALRDRVSGRFSRRYTLRLMACVGVAGVMSEVLALQRSYWVVLTVAIVLKPDFGSVFVRAVHRGVGTVIGAVLGAVILAAVPHGPWLLIPFGILAALLPYGRSRTYGLFATFLTPLVVVLIDLLAPGGWRLAEARLLDTLLGCGIVLLVGYAPWPMSWHAHLPGQFAETVRDVTRYMDEALMPARTGPPARSRLRRQVYRALSDLRAQFQRAMSEPGPASRRATAWWPTLAALENLADAVTATAVAISHGVPAPSRTAVRSLTAALDTAAAELTGDRPPATGPPADEPLAPVTAAVRSVLTAMANSRVGPARPESRA